MSPDRKIESIAELVSRWASTCGWGLRSMHWSKSSRSVYLGLCRGVERVRVRVSDHLRKQTGYQVIYRHGVVGGLDTVITRLGVGVRLERVSIMEVEAWLR